MQIRCLKCKKVFGITKEQLKKINEIAIGQLNPSDYLDLFPLISGKCGDKKHAFIYADEFTDQKKGIIQTYDEVNKFIETSKESLKLMADKEKELGLEKEKLTKRLEEIRDELFANDQSINAISLVKIPADEAQIECILDQFDSLVGTRDIESWKDVVIASIESKTTVPTTPTS